MSSYLLEGVVLSGLVLIIFACRADLRRQMIWAGLLALPILIIQPLISIDSWSLISSSDLTILFLERAVIGFSLGALASSFYETFLRHRFTRSVKPARHNLALLLAGPILWVILLGLFNFSLSWSLIGAYLIDLIIILTWRRDLIWDALFSGLGMGLLYLVIFRLTFLGIPGSTGNFWFVQNLSGLNILSLPVEELVTVILFGSLWGPIYVAVKDLQQIN